MSASRASLDPLYPRHGNGEVPVVTEIRRCAGCGADVTSSVAGDRWGPVGQEWFCGKCFILKSLRETLWVPR